MTPFARRVTPRATLALGLALASFTLAAPAVAGDPETCSYRDARLAHACRTNLEVRGFLSGSSGTSVEHYMDVPPIYRGWAPGEEAALDRVLGMGANAGRATATAAPATAAPATPTYSSNSPAGVMDRINRLASGEYAASVEAERARTPAVSLTPAQARVIARRAVADKLRDPSSAQFRNVRRVTADNGQLVFCGEVNGRNAYGGYAGFVRFEASAGRTGGGYALLDSQESLARAYFHSAWNQTCGRSQGTAVQF